MIDTNVPSCLGLLPAQAGTAPIVTRHLLCAPPEQVFAAWTQPPLWAVWWGPRDAALLHGRVEGRVGGRHEWQGRSADGAVVRLHGLFHELAEPEWIVCTLNWQQGTRQLFQMIVTATLHDHPQGTALRMHGEPTHHLDPAARELWSSSAHHAMQRLDAVLRALPPDLTPPPGPVP